jgi:hypothetical protein
MIEGQEVKGRTNSPTLCWEIAVAWQKDCVPRSKVESYACGGLATGRSNRAGQVTA